MLVAFQFWDKYGSSIVYSKESPPPEDKHLQEKVLLPENGFDAPWGLDQAMFLPRPKPRKRKSRKRKKVVKAEKENVGMKLG